MFLVAGEALMDLVPQRDGAFRALAGGAPYNFARALALQGVPAEYVNPLSEDVFGDTLRESLLQAGAQHAGTRSSKPTSLAIVSTDATGHPRYSFHREGVADRALTLEDLVTRRPASLLGFHTGALALVPPDHTLALAALRHFRAHGVLCSVDVNMRPAVAASQGVALADYRAAAMQAMACADVVKLSDEDLLALSPGASIAQAAQSLLAQGCKLVLITLGAQGSTLYCKHGVLEQTAPPARVVDTVGAGDAFFAGFVAALHHEGWWRPIFSQLPAATALTQALRHAAACAALTIEREGCQPPNWSEALARRQLL